VQGQQKYQYNKFSESVRVPWRVRVKQREGQCESRACGRGWNALIIYAAIVFVMAGAVVCAAAAKLVPSALV